MGLKPQSILEIEVQKRNKWKEETAKVPKWYVHRAYACAMSMFVLGIIMGVLLGDIIWRS